MFGGIFIGLLPQMAMLGAAVYGVLTVFQLVTLPVEFDASARAKQRLVASEYWAERELEAWETLSTQPHGPMSRPSSARSAGCSTSLPQAGTSFYPQRPSFRRLP
jgi:hypothetical protein